MKNKIHIIQDVDKSIEVMKNAGEWLETSDKHPSKWWQPENMTREFLLQYTDENQFYVGLVDNKPAVAAILQFDERNQDWSAADPHHQKALYIHWLCVHREFAGLGLPKIIVDFAENLAKEKGVNFLRADTNADVLKLNEVYKKLGFDLVKTVIEDYRKTAFYQKAVI